MRTVLRNDIRINKIYDTGYNACDSYLGYITVNFNTWHWKSDRRTVLIRILNISHDSHGKLLYLVESNKRPVWTICFSMIFSQSMTPMHISDWLKMKPGANSTLLMSMLIRHKLESKSEEFSWSIFWIKARHILLDDICLN